MTALKKSGYFGGVLLLALLMATTGCSFSRGFHGSPMHQRFKPEKENIDPADIDKVYKLKPRLKRPFRLAVHNWTDGGLENLRKQPWIVELQQAGVISDVSLTRDARGTLAELRSWAALTGADALLEIEYRFDTQRTNNMLSLLYLTIIGLFIIPGTNVDAQVEVKGALWDVRNEYLYATFKGSGEAGRFGSAVILENQYTLELAEKRAFEAFTKKVVAGLKNL